MFVVHTKRKEFWMKLKVLSFEIDPDDIPDAGLHTFLSDGSCLVLVWAKESEYTTDEIHDNGIVFTSNERNGNFLAYRIFFQKPIYLSLETIQAERVPAGDTIVFGATGFSSFNSERLTLLGIKSIDDYLAPCANILDELVVQFQEQYPSCNIAFVDGASFIGVDKVVISTAMQHNLGGFSIIPLMWSLYVRDDHRPLLLVASKEEYENAFSEALDILLLINGGAQAYRFDVKLAMFGIPTKQVIPIDVLSIICKNGKPPAVIGTTVVDAIGLLEANLLKMWGVSYIAQRFLTLSHLKQYAIENALEAARKLLGSAAYNHSLKESLS